MKTKLSFVTISILEWWWFHSQNEFIYFYLKQQLLWFSFNFEFITMKWFKNCLIFLNPHSRQTHEDCFVCLKWDGNVNAFIEETKTSKIETCLSSAFVNLAKSGNCIWKSNLFGSPLIKSRNRMLKLYVFVSCRCRRRCCSLFFIPELWRVATNCLSPHPSPFNPIRTHKEIKYWMPLSSMFIICLTHPFVESKSTLS